MKIGYARVSTKGQKLDAQMDALKKSGAEKIFADIASGVKAERPELERMREQLRKGDTLVIQRLDRLGRSMTDLVAWVQWLEDQGIKFQSLHENIDTSTTTGKLVFHIFGALAETRRPRLNETGCRPLDSGTYSGRARSSQNQRQERWSYQSFDCQGPKSFENIIRG